MKDASHYKTEDATSTDALVFSIILAVQGAFWFVVGIWIGGQL